jgi:hypothetical protein
LFRRLDLDTGSRRWLWCAESQNALARNAVKRQASPERRLGDSNLAGLFSGLLSAAFFALDALQLAQASLRRRLAFLAAEDVEPAIDSVDARAK